MLEWVDTVSKWDFNRIVPAHFDNDVRANNGDFRRAFNFLRAEKPFVDKVYEYFGRGQAYMRSGDLKLLEETSDLLTSLKILYPKKDLIGASKDTPKASAAVK